MSHTVTMSSSHIAAYYRRKTFLAETYESYQRAWHRGYWYFTRAAGIFGRTKPVRGI